MNEGNINSEARTGLSERKELIDWVNSIDIPE